MATETWLLNSFFDFENSQWTTLSASFTSNGQSFSSIKYRYAPTSYMYINYDNTWVYDDDDHTGWANEAYRTIVLDTPATGNLLTWLEANATKQASTSRISVDLATAFPDKWAALTSGEHTIQIRAKNPGNYLDSDLSAAVKVLKIINYPITVNATNCTAVSSNPTVVPSNTTGTVLKFTANTGYNLPTSVTVSGATSSWNRSTGELTLTKPTGNVSVTIAGTVQTYNITTTTESATADPNNPKTITYGSTATLKFTFPTGYESPSDDNVTVTGATKQWTQSTGTLVLSNPTGNVTVKVVGQEAVAQLSGLWKWNETIPDGDWTEQAVEFTLQDGTAYKKMYWSDDGTTYELYYDDELEGGSATKVYSYNADEQTGTWIDAKYRIIDFGTLVQVTQIFYNYVNANATQPTQLSTPQNVTADGTVVSWDEVENATEYGVYADGTSIGTVQAQSSETWVLNDDLNETELPRNYVNFTSNSANYSSILFTVGTPAILEYDSTEVYQSLVVPGESKWSNEAYRTITFDTTPTGDLLNWLQANGVKQ